MQKLKGSWGRGRPRPDIAIFMMAEAPTPVFRERAAVILPH
jgi:hypothetical protein